MVGQVREATMLSLDDLPIVAREFLDPELSRAALAHVSATRVLYPASVKVRAASEKATRAPAIFWVRMRASGGQ